MATSINLCPEKEHGPPIPQAAKDLLALRLSYRCVSSLRTVSFMKLFLHLVLYGNINNYSKKISSLPSPERTILILYR
jgi:hypothetical protein